MTDKLTHQIEQLRAEIQSLQQALASLAALPHLQEPLRAAIATKEARLAALHAQTGGVNLGGATIDQVADIVGGDKVGGDKVGGDKTVTSGPQVTGPIQSGRDINIGTTQIINNSTPPIQPLTLPPLQLWLEDCQGQPLPALTVNQEALLRAGIADAAPALPHLDLLLEAGGDGVAWPDDTRRKLMLRPGQALRPARWSVLPERVGSLTLRVQVLREDALLREYAITVGCVDAG